MTVIKTNCDDIHGVDNLHLKKQVLFVESPSDADTVKAMLKHLYGTDTVFEVVSEMPEFPERPPEPCLPKPLKVKYNRAAEAGYILTTSKALSALYMKGKK